VSPSASLPARGPYAIAAVPEAVAISGPGPAADPDPLIVEPGESGPVTHILCRAHDCRRGAGEVIAQATTPDLLWAAVCRLAMGRESVELEDAGDGRVVTLRRPRTSRQRRELLATIRRDMDGGAYWHTCPRCGAAALIVVEAETV
jgi:hypothetical protein